MSVGIDYGMGRTNVDHENGIRYGVISQHSVLSAWCESAEPDYGKPTCPKCGNEVKAFDGPENDQWFPRYHDYGYNDYVCEACEHTLDSQDVYGEEPIGWNYSGEGYELADCLDSDIFVLKSPYYTFAEFCSPCVPGAGNIESYNENGAKTYCLGHDWFFDNEETNGKAPYPVYRVADDTLVIE